jgi:hypothetical protein
MLPATLYKVKRKFLIAEIRLLYGHELICAIKRIDVGGREAGLHYGIVSANS